jgi:hypothetical protein
MSDTSHTAFFGDRERTFRLTPPMIVELERVTGAGIGSLCARVFSGAEFKHAELHETIRLALIGAGTDPAEAAALVNAYVIDRPLAEVFPLTLAILNALWSGTPAEPTNG